MKISKLFMAVLLLSLAPLALGGEAFPTLVGRVNDYAKVLSAAEAKSLESKLAQHEATSSDQIVILTVDTLNGRPIEDYAEKLFKTWKLGQKGKDNGVLVVLATKDRKIRIEVGYGLEGRLTDAISSRIIREEMGPRFKQNKYYDGFNAAADKIVLAIQGEYKADKPKASTDGGNDGTIGLLFVGAAIVFVLSAVGGCFHRAIGGLIGCVGGFFLGLKILLSIGIGAAFAVLGLLIGLVSRDILQGLAESGLSGGGGGGGGGSSDSGGGSSSESYGGGGGESGGGGASGSY